MSGITFGSVGDIIAVGQIALLLVKALSDIRGSMKEYQCLIKELESFDQAMLQVVALWQNYDNSPELNHLGTITKSAIRNWRDEMLAFRLNVDKKYGKRLCQNGSGSWLKDTSKKVLWLKEKENILALRQTLSTASDTVMMLVLAAMANSNRLVESDQALRVQLVSYKLQEQDLILKAMDVKLEAQAKNSHLILTTIRSGVSSVAHIYAVVLESRVMLRCLQNHIYTQHATPRGLGTHWAQQPVTLEDALGRLVPLPLELVDSWEMFDMILSKRFESHPGYKKVANGEFVIEDSVSGVEINREWNWSQCFRPGQKADMAMIFSASPYLDMASDCCPRCKTGTSTTTRSRVQCSNPICRMWFQRVITEAIEGSDSDSTAESLDKSPQDEVESDFKRPTLRGIVRPEQFQRVRLNFLSLSSRHCYSCFRLDSSRCRQSLNGARTLCDKCGAHYPMLTRELVPKKVEKLPEHLAESLLRKSIHHTTLNMLETTASEKCLTAGWAKDLHSISFEPLTVEPPQTIRPEFSQRTSCQHCKRKQRNLSNIPRHERACKMNPNLPKCKLYKCLYPSCTCAFTRLDNLHTHQERQGHLDKLKVHGQATPSLISLERMALNEREINDD